MNWLTRFERPMKTLIVIAMTACAATPTQIDSTAGQASIECSEAATEYNRCIAIKPDQTPKPRSAEVVTMPRLIASSLETIAVFRKLGFQILTTNPTTIVLQHDGRDVAVPRDRRLTVDTLRRVLRDAQVSEAMFTALLAERTSHLRDRHASIR
jgi:hypothetical protein